VPTGRIQVLRLVEAAARTPRRSPEQHHVGIVAVLIFALAVAAGRRPEELQNI
jgi:hypothetical protein